MGLFSLFRKKPKEKIAVKQVEPLEDKGVPSNQREKFLPVIEMPTKEQDPDLYETYRTIFFNEMSTIQMLSQDQINAIYDEISQGEGVQFNMGRYHYPVFEKYFQGKNWVWPEFEKWDKLFANLKHYPVGWVKSPHEISKLSDQERLSMLKMADLKELLKGAGVSVPSKATKDILIKAALSPVIVESIKSSKIAQEAAFKYTEKRNAELYGLLMRTILFRAKSLYDQKRIEKLGMSMDSVEMELLVVYEEDRVLINLALKENPNALTPLFPGDFTVRAVKFDFE